MDAGKALRWLGFQVSLESLEDLIAQVDVEETHHLVALELRMLVCEVQDREHGKAQEAFEHLRAEAQIPSLDHDAVRLLLHQLGLDFEEEQLKPDLGSQFYLDGRDTYLVNFFTSG